MTLKLSDLNQKASDLLVKLYHFSYNYSYILSTAALAIIYIQHPELRWVYHYAIGGMIIALVVFVIVFCPLLVLIGIFAPILWLSEKLEKKHMDKKQG